MQTSEICRDVIALFFYMIRVIVAIWILATNLTIHELKSGLMEF